MSVYYQQYVVTHTVVFKVSLMVLGVVDGFDDTDPFPNY